MKKELTFEGFGKIPRLNRDCTITEKIDGTNAQLVFDAEGGLLVGSRRRVIFPNGTKGQPKGCDNYGFALWATTNQEALFEYLGEGRHFGEWHGLGIQRNYGLKRKEFALFNTFRHSDTPKPLLDIGLTTVPVLYQGIFTTAMVRETLRDLEANGSRIGEKFMNPEGVIVYHEAAKQYFKATVKNDEKHKFEV